MNRITRQFAMAATLAALANQVAAAPCFQWPFSAEDYAKGGNGGGACRISSGYKWREFPKGTWEFHNGLDIACRDGVPMRAVIDGIAYRDGSLLEGPHVIRMVSPQLNAALGKKVKISYLHGQSWAVPHGAAVRAGEIVAFSGHAGSRVTGPHLHLAVMESLTDTVIPGSHQQTKVMGTCNFPKILADGTKICNRGASIDPMSLMCGGGPVKGPLDSPSDPALAPRDTATGGPVAFGATPPGETPPPGPEGLEGSASMEHLANDIANRAFNPEYTIQLASLGQASLYRELAYLDALKLKIDYLNAKGRARREALQAALLSLRTRQLQGRIQQQKRVASGTK